MTPLARIKRYLASTGRDGPCRVLLVFGNPLGNALGDTVIALDHARYLPQLTADVRLSVWTGDPDVWTHVHPTVRVEPFVGRQALARDYNVVVFASTPVPNAARQVLRDAGVVVLSWFAGQQAVAIALGATDAFAAPLPPFINYTLRVPEVYRTLGWAAVPRLRRARRSRSPVVVLNPYASRAGKSLTPGLLARLLAELDRARDDASFSMVVPSRPPGLTRVDDSAYGGLAALLAASASRCEVLPALDRAAYFSRIENAALVIGPDTSTQHLAAAFGVPSIACYPPVGGGSYLDWGPTDAASLHFTMPADGDRGAERSLARLVRVVALRLIGKPPAPADHRVGAALLAEVRAFVSACDAYLRGDDQARRRARAALVRSVRVVGRDWAAHLLGELHAVYEDLPALRVDGSVDDRRVVRARLRHLNVERVARLLAAAQRMPSSSSTVSWSSRS